MDSPDLQSCTSPLPVESVTPDVAPQPWWRGAVIYQVYPRSFMDSNGDGVGDLPGIIDRLGYIVDLGVDAIWVSPFFRSPMKDFGYDVSDYRTVDPVFGTLADFDRLVQRAHASGLKVIIDQVLSHSSDQHPWFKESRASRDNGKANWYVWSDPEADGTPPNNWLSVFGGSAWQWEPRRKQYYLHNFLASQPDLNYHEPAVLEQMLEEVRFWLERGVNGMRLDAINFCYHDGKLRDNPPKPAAERIGRGYRTDNPYAWQYHLYDNTQPENLRFLERLRALSDGYQDVVLLGEVTGENPIETMREYTSGSNRLHMAYNFELLADDFCLRHIRDAVESLEGNGGNCWPCRAIGNHDVARVSTRWGSKGGKESKGSEESKASKGSKGSQDGVDDSTARPKLLNALLLSLKGSVCSYQGDELGLTQAEIAPEDIRDPYGVAFWPLYQGRDGCRTPMPWSSAHRSGGFSTARPWLPLPEEHLARAVDRQLCDADSVLAGYRAFVRWRRTRPELLWGNIRFLDSPEDTIAFVREYEGERLLCVFNFSSGPLAYSLPMLAQAVPHSGHGFAACTVEAGRLALPGYGACFARVP